MYTLYIFSNSLCFLDFLEVTKIYTKLPITMQKEQKHIESRYDVTNTNTNTTLEINTQFH